MLRRTLSLAALALATTAYAPGGRTLSHGAARARALTEPPAVAREFRAAWISPIPDRGLRDWPSAPGLTPDSQRTELIALLDRAQALGLNAVILHVRLAADALYPTRYGPWSSLLTGKSGVAPKPAYDPLAFAVQAAHARGLQLHAWFNPFRAALPDVKGPLAKMAPSHVTRVHPEWIRRYGTQTWIDPGDPAARAWALDAILDVVRRYDVDGVHVDDYFYPYRESRIITRRVHGRRVRERRDIAFPDSRTWKKYGQAKGFTDRDAWRRSNIDSFVQALYTRVKAIRPSVVVGISPFGIWRPGSPPGITGLDAFGEIYADSRRWLAQGWVDYLAPQLYWPLDGTENRFRLLDAWWREQNPQGRYIWPALYSAHVFGDQDRWPPSEIAAQVAEIREARIGSTDVPGHIHFRLSALLADGGVLGAQLAPLYAEPALPPSYPWLGSTTPASPRLSVLTGDGPPSLTIVPGDSLGVRWWLVQTRAPSGAWTAALRPAGAAHVTLDGGIDEIAVTAVSATGMTSAPAVAAADADSGSSLGAALPSDGVVRRPGRTSGL
jgi:uncharacterized lipoprotein YddW (UPF0748 family)